MSAFRGRPRRPAASDAPNPLDGLLQDMRDLRLTLAADLHAAAAAAEDGATQVASDIVEADREELARFRRVAEMRMSRLSGAAAEPATYEPAADEPAAPRWRRRVVVALPAVPLVGAMAVSAAAVTGVLPLPDHNARTRQATAQSSRTSPVASSFQQLEAIVDSRQSSAGEVIAAARALHRQLAAMIASTSGDPAQAAEVAELLRLEQSLMMSAQPPGASIVLDATRRLARQLVNNTSSTVSKVAPTSTTLPKPLPTSSPKSTKTSSSPAPKKSSSPKPSSSSSPAPTPSSSGGGGTIPAVP